MIERNDFTIYIFDAMYPDFLVVIPDENRPPKKMAAVNGFFFHVHSYKINKS